MCSIIGLLPETTPSPEAIEKMLKWGEKRGTDAFGCSIHDHNGDLVYLYKQAGIPNAPEIASSISTELRPGSVLLASYRAAPETEVVSSYWDCIQPVMSNVISNLSIVHNGAVSNKVYKDLKNIMENTDIKPSSKLDTEAIIWAYYVHGCNMKKTMEYLSGGFAFLMVDFKLQKLYAVCTHNPLYCGYVKGFGVFFASMEEAIYDVISCVKGTQISRQNIARWEDFYAREIPENTITEFDLDSAMINEVKFTPRYIHPNYDPLGKINTDKTKVLVSASGGLDSSTTLAVMKNAGYDVTAIHFKYGHRGGAAEKLAIENVCEILDIPIVTFDISANMKILDTKSMLTDPNHDITTGTEDGLKTTVAWTCFRNGFFMTYMGALAESLIINEGYDNVYLTGGFLNLTESGPYVDNSERFVKAFSKFAKFASIVGTKIKPLYGCANLLKTEQYILLYRLGLLEKLGQYLISCDRPKIKPLKNDHLWFPTNCSKDGKPACGSGALSRWAIDRIGLKDPRLYYEVDDPDYELYTPPEIKEKYIWPSTDKILSKLQIHSENIEILRKQMKGVKDK